MTRILGIDPSLTSTGLALVEGGRVVQTQRVKSKKAGHARIDEILDAIWNIGPDKGALDLKVGIEGPAMGAKGRSVVQIFGLWWVIAHQLHTWSLPYYVVPPSNLKIYATGNGGADKDSVLLAVDRRYPDAHVGGNDVADALVIAAIGARHHGEPLESSMPANHLRALDGVQWPAS